ncbi:hypothetical protein [Levilactobacillus sp. N40-8-2]|uniref:hypothetical protein n=1 Tax=Levilactobacillus muriae TaxID=3238987 RepID=UPI0038B2F5D8
MIIATGSVNIDENTKLAEQAGADNEEALKDLKTSMDGKITISTQAPFNDGVDHADGDLWLIQSDNVTTAMYTYGAGGWSEKQWDQETLNVKELSALSANLGTINAGILNSVEIDSSTIKSANLTEDYTSGGVHRQLWIDYNGFHYRNTDSSGGQNDVKMNDYTGMYISRSGGGTDSGYNGHTSIEGNDISTGNVNADGVLSNSVGTTTVNTSHLNMNLSTINSYTGSFYFEGGEGGSGEPGADVHAASFNKMSQLSVKRNIQDVTGDYALAQILGTDVKRYDYRLSDNSQQTNIGPIIDDENKIGSKKYDISSDMINSQSDGVSIDNEVGLLMAAVKELTKRNSDLQLRVTQLESEVKA